MSRRAALGLTAIGLLYVTRYLWAFEIAWYKDDFLFLDLARRLSFDEVWGAQDAIGNAYRPLSRNVYFWSLQHLFGAEAAGYHAVNLVVALSGLALFFAVARRLITAEGPALLATLLFALHPAAGMPATWVSGIQDLLAVTLVLGAVLAHLAGRRVVYAVLFAAAVLAKEVAVFLPAVLFVYDVLNAKAPWGRALVRQLPALAFLGGWAILNPWLPWNELGAQVHARPSDSVRLFGRRNLGAAALALRSLVLAEPIEKFAWPYGLATTAAMVVLTALALAAAYSLPSARRLGRSLLVVALLWCITGILPLIAVESRFVYYAYYPAIGFSLLVALLMAGIGSGSARTPSRRLAFALAALACTALGAAAGFEHHPALHDAASLRRADVILTGLRRDLLAMHPSFRPGARCFFWDLPVHAGFQMADGPALRVWYDDPNLEGRFIREYTRDPSRPTFFFVYDSGRLVEVHRGLPDPAIDRPPAIYASAHAHLAYWLAQEGEMEAAIAECRKALTVDPEHRAASANLGIFLVESGGYEEGIAALAHAIRLDPTTPELRFYRGVGCAMLGRHAEAEQELSAFLAAAPASPNRAAAAHLLEQVQRTLAERGGGTSSPTP
jgi:tetratricopeptide (TPR) repeat protein